MNYWVPHWHFHGRAEINHRQEGIKALDLYSKTGPSASPLKVCQELSVHEMARIRRNVGVTCSGFRD
jgi:hypothetical protein